MGAPHTNPPQRNGSTRAWRQLRDRILRESDICHICGQPGADAVDHIIPVTRGGTNHPTNLRPAHHNVQPKCNRVKGNKNHAPIIRRSGSLNRPN